ncbi:MAG: HD domain-containing protein, partial [Butyricicoccus sp.]|nr:HD domain-containing protein [Butyricicoccus sp.]
MEARDTLLLSCGPAEFRASLRPLFEDSFNLLEAANGQQTKLFLQQNLSCIAAVILNITDPTKVDASIMQDPEFAALLTDIPLVLIANKDRPQVVSEVFDFGATDVYPPNVHPELLQYRIHNIVELYRHKWHLQDLVDEQAAVLRHSNDAMVDALSSIIEYRSVESGQHILRIRRFTQILLEEVARCCPEYELDPTAIRLISSASALHDIGKISIPDAILNKPGRLTADEWEVMESHSLTGCRILESLGDIGDPDYLRYGHNICHYHHERWDGNGYPEGLVGDEIPICAQVVGLADAYDALTSKRVYKDAYSYDKSANMIVNGECGVFSPKLLECFKHVAPQFAELAQAYTDGQAPKAENFDVT